MIIIVDPLAKDIGIRLVILKVIEVLRVGVS